MANFLPQVNTQYSGACLAGFSTHINELGYLLLTGKKSNTTGQESVAGRLTD
jgi:hypothetical protein